MPEFPTSGPVTMSIRLGRGTIAIIAEPRTTTLVEVTPGDTSDRAGQSAEQTRITHVDNQLSIEAPESQGWPLFRRGAKINVRIRVPQDSRLISSRSFSADLTCTGRLAELEVSTGSGDLDVEHVATDATINAASGDVRIGHCGRRLAVSQASGDLTVGYVGGALTTKTVSGDIHITEAAASVRASSTSGDIHIGTARQGNVHVNTVSGDVHVGIVAGTKVWLDLSTVSGSARSDLALSETAPPTGSDLNLQVRTVSGDIDTRRVRSDEEPGERLPRQVA